MKIFCSIFTILNVLLFTSCRVESQKVTEKDAQEVQPVAVKDLAIGYEEKLNPNEAIINVSITKTAEENGSDIISAEVVSVEKRGFGFKSNLNKGDLILIQSAKEEEIGNLRNLKCKISEVVVPQQDKPTFKLIKLFQ